MEGISIAVSLLLFTCTLLIFTVIVRDVFPSLDAEERQVLRGFGGISGWAERNEVLRKAWNEHGRLFPKSPKRPVFAFLLIVSLLSVMGYPLWRAFGAR